MYYIHMVLLEVMRGHWIPRTRAGSEPPCWELNPVTQKGASPLSHQALSPFLQQTLVKLTDDDSFLLLGKKILSYICMGEGCTG